MNTQRYLLLLALTCVLAGGAAAYESPGACAFAPVPPHTPPWVEWGAPDVRTVFLWKFKSGADEARALDNILDQGDLAALIGGAGDAAPAPAPVRKGVEPLLKGGAKPLPGGGRFGGGLGLDGTGYASCFAPVRDLLATEGGLTFDFWFRPRPDAAFPATLFAFCDARDRPLLAAACPDAGRVVLSVGGEPRLEVPLHETADGWHHAALTLSGGGDHTELHLAVDGTTRSALKPDPFTPIPWMRGVPQRLGGTLHVGGTAGLPGLQGAVDEVRLSGGIRHLYLWNLGPQTAPTPSERRALRAPFFRKTELLTRFRFDGALEPDAFAGRSWTGQADASHFQPGLSGQALDLSRIDKTGFAMKGFYLLPEKEGTIEFWFRPLDWNNFFVGGYAGDGVQCYHLLQLHSKDAHYGIRSTPTKDIEVFRGRAQRDTQLHWQKFHPGTWTHVLITLVNGGQTVYVNGRQQKLWQAGFVTQGHPLAQEPLKKWRERTGGKDEDDTWTWRFVPSPTLIDEFTVFSRGMNAEEAWNAYARWLPEPVAALKPLPIFRIGFDYFAHSWSLEEKLDVRLECLPVGEVAPASADCELRDAAGAVLLAVEKQPLADGGAATFTLKRPLAFGSYPVTIRSRDAHGNILKEEDFVYTREQPEWLGNALGEERIVPKDWTPMTVKGRTVGVIGREIELGANGLPSRIEALGAPLLAAPVEMRVGGAELTGPGPTFTETAPDRVAWQAALAGGGIKAELDAWLEFDGLLYCAITLKPVAGAEATVADLDIDFPLAAARATQLLANGGGNDFRASWLATYMPAGEGSVWDSLKPTFQRAHGVSNFIPHLWVGSDDAGLYFGAENDKGWTVDGPKPAQEILRQGGVVTVRLNIIREPTPIPAAGRRFHFVLLPTPAKPEPADWRYQMLAGGVNFGSCDTFGGFDLKTDPADPSPGDPFRLEPRSWEHAVLQAPQCRAKWGRCILYTDAAFAQPGPAFRDWNHDLHAGTGRHAWTPEFEDYAVWAINEFLKRGVIDGVYWDDVSVGHTYSLASTAYEYAGSENGRRVGFTALAQRRANLRLWRLFEAAGKEPCIWAHMTVCYEVPLFSFCRYLSNVEFVTGVDFPGTRDAMDMWSPDMLRILGGSAKWGVGYHNLSTLPRTLPDTAAARQWAYPQQRTETGLYMTADQFGPADGLGRKLVAERLFDGPVRAYPWWKADEVVELTASEGAAVRAGVYVAEGRTVVVVANWDREEREVVITLQPQALAGAAGGVAWRDLDPGLKPPAEVMAGAEEITRAGEALGGVPGEGQPLDAAALDNLLEGVTPAERALQRLDLRTEGNKAILVIRPRDYRVLEAKAR